MVRFSPIKGATSAMVPRQAMRSRGFERGGTIAADGDRLRQLERQSGAGEIAEGIAAGGLVRVDLHGLRGNLVRRQVVIRDDDVDARLARSLDRRAAPCCRSRR